MTHNNYLTIMCKNALFKHETAKKKIEEKRKTKTKENIRLINYDSCRVAPLSVTHT